MRELVQSERDPLARSLAEQRASAALAQRLGITDQRTLSALEATLRAGPERAAQPARAPVPAPARARSPERRDAVALHILGALLDFPELLHGPEVLEAAELLEGDAALALAALRQGWESDGLRDTEVVLAKLAPSIHPFARARLAAPKHMTVNEAQAELAGTVRQLKALALTRDRETVVQELGRTRTAGDFERDLQVLDQLFKKARRHRIVASE